MPIGTLCLIDRQSRAFSDGDRDSLATLASLVEAEIAGHPASESQNDLIRNSDEHARRELIDPVTQTWNEPALKILLEREIQLAVSNKDEYALLSLEITIAEGDFSSMSEEQGAILLRKDAQDVRSAIRPYDFFARTGLSRLVVFSPKCDGSLSDLVFDRIRARIEQSPNQVNGMPIDLTVRCGIAHTSAGTTPQVLLDTANQALSDAIKDGSRSQRYIV